jgi:hypothetical protein|tara:strand:+ start:171 stop:392 length:222 start_codon:yes stop_codon:yes gene_type:complete
MSTQYKKNNFSTEKLSIPFTTSQNNIDKTARPNIDHLIKRILVERRREKRNFIALGFVILSITVCFIFFKISV